MQQDYTFNLEPGEREFVTIGEVEFLFIKAADRPVVLTVDGYSQVMEVNQKTRSEKRFSRFELENPDPDLPLTITLVAGLGDYTTQSIKGELNVVPSIIKADGTIQADDRFFVDLHISPDQKFTTLSVEAGELIKRNKLRDIVVGEFPFGAAFADGVLVAQDQEHGSGGWVKLDYRTLDGELNETRTMNHPAGAGPIWARSLTAIDDEYFFLGAYINPDLDSRFSPAVYLCRWYGGVAEFVADDPLYVGPELTYSLSNTWSVAVGVHYDADTKTAWFGYQHTSDKDQITLVELAYNDSLKTLSVTSETHYDPGGTDARVMAIGRINGELLLSLWLWNTNDNQIYRVSDGALLWVGNLERLSNYQVIRGLSEVNARAYTVEIEQTTLNDVYLGERYNRNATYNFAGRVMDQQEACFTGLFKPLPSTNTEALVTADNVGGNRFRVSGEVIRAALEMFFGGPIVPEYLDAIYGVEIQDTASAPRWYKFYSGNASFRRYGKADDFSLLVPGTLRLFVDSTFWSLEV